MKQLGDQVRQFTGSARQFDWLVRQSGIWMRQLARGVQVRQFIGHVRHYETVWGSGEAVY